MNATDTERGWVAATLSNGGTFSKNRVRITLASGEEKEYVYPRVEFFSKDEWVIDRLVSATGYGIKSFRPERGSERGPDGGSDGDGYGLWRWKVTRQEDVRDLAIEILPLMGEKRRQDVLGVL